MDQTSDRYLEFKQELQDVMAETVGEIKPELAAEFEWRTYVQRYPGTCLWAGGALGWQKIALTVSPCSRTAEKSGFRILDVPKNGRQGGFLIFSRGASFNCRKDEALLERDNPFRQRRAAGTAQWCLDIAHRKEDAVVSVATKVRDPLTLIVGIILIQPGGIERSSRREQPSGLSSAPLPTLTAS